MYKADTLIIISFFIATLCFVGANDPLTIVDILEISLGYFMVGWVVDRIIKSYKKK